MVLIYASTRWSHICLLSTRNVAFARLLAQIIRLREQFLNYLIRKILLDNAGEFTSQVFNDYCMSIGIDVEHSICTFLNPLKHNQINLVNYPSDYLVKLTNLG